MNIEIQHNKEYGIFQTTINNEKSFLSYRKKSVDTLEFYETFVPEKNRGQKIASQLALRAMSYVQENHLKIIPTCSFVSAFVKKNQEFNDLVAKA